ncbi:MULTISPECIES: DNA polymerase III subunit chi [Bartonella]|uniref:Putative DNA polymerase III chi subunit n=1 Tax=Bartonella rochalimae ATCC BAA-1498 TaxID=685782 RepID=E6YLA7_9HYPH|nr:MULTISPECIES: DNA polymerase III subunit chi [Bartonella]AQX18531.1 DNA polymerase III, chi subunit [Bartonella sp. A1379B]AQX23045.1 DNA polymerase III, chi subunit [Bartonella sp. 11B]AQX23658.1 DNA polymerase III, chi subunit [Bartonella sp. 114]AQX25500.1 DNA polymerase III, chi subunit [Bartonella sp. Coyote22sub2]AQX26797.1 DNA polymerase III, chi subunit [Bartonella sp. Raccoon60]
MVDILFYHLTKSTLKETLPVLVERALKRFGRITIQCMNKEQCNFIDTCLWVYADESFIGHGTEYDKYPDLQPVFLTTGQENPNDSKVRFLIDGAVCSDVDIYQRLVIMFDGHNDTQLNLIREQWKDYKTKNYNLTYWQQTEDYRWEQKV